MTDRILHPTFNSGKLLGPVPPKRADEFKEMPIAQTSADHDAVRLIEAVEAVSKHGIGELSLEGQSVLIRASDWLSSLTKPMRQTIYNPANEQPFYREF